jgi:hypothetical protein
VEGRGATDGVVGPQEFAARLPRGCPAWAGNPSGRRCVGSPRADGGACMGRVDTSPERERWDSGASDPPAYAGGFYGGGLIQARSVSDGIPCASDPPAYAEGFYGGGFIQARSVSDGIPCASDPPAYAGGLYGAG